KKFKVGTLVEKLSQFKSPFEFLECIASHWALEVNKNDRMLRDINDSVPTVFIKMIERIYTHINKSEEFKRYYENLARDVFHAEKPKMDIPSPENGWKMEAPHRMQKFNSKLLIFKTLSAI